MKRPMCVIGLVLTLTTLAAFFIPVSVALPLSGAALATGLLVAVLRRGRHRLLATVCIVASVGFMVRAVHAYTQVAPLEGLLDQTVEIRGLVTQVDTGNRAVFYTVDAHFPQHPDLPRTSVSLRAYGEKEFLAGEEITGLVKLDDVMAQPGEYGYNQGIYLSGVGEDVALAGGNYSLQAVAVRLRAKMQRNVLSHLPGESGQVVSSMVLGLRDDLDADLYSAMNRAGTAHLISVSGLHLAVAATLARRLLGRLGASRRAAGAAAILAVFAFAMLVGFSTSVTRSFVMIAIAQLAGFARRKSDSLSSLGLAVAVICLARPAWVLGRGFWFSAASTLGILTLGQSLVGRLKSRWEGGKIPPTWARALLEALAISGAAYVFTLPLMMVFNGWITLLSPLANALVTPFVTPLIAGGMVCALFEGGGLPLAVVAKIVAFCSGAVVRLSEIISALPVATASLDDGWVLLWLVFALAVVIVLVLHRHVKGLAVYGAAFLVVLFGFGRITQMAADRGTMEFAVIEGCDAAVLIRQRDAVILGTPKKSEINRLLRYLEFRGVGNIRAVVAADCGEQVDSGLLRLEARYPVDCIVGPNDSYILGQLAKAMEGVPVYSGGYARLRVLDGADIALNLPAGDIMVQTASATILKSTGEYDIIKAGRFGNLEYYPNGILVLNEAAGTEPTPVGAALYGERRFRLWL